MDEQFNSKQRLDYIDTYRGIGILLMVMGHVGFGAEFNHWIHGFHMPLFFFLSGYLHNNRYHKGFSIFEYIKNNGFKYVKKLLLPYFIWGLFHLIIFAIINCKIDSIHRAIIALFWNNTSDNFPYAGALWFLTALFICSSIYLVVDCFKYQWIKHIITLLFVILGLITSSVLHIELPYGCNAALVGVGFYHMGFCLKKNSLMERFRLNIVIVLFFLFTLLIFFNGYVNLRIGVYGNPLLFFLSAIAMCVILWVINYKMVSYYPQIIKRMLLIMGEDSLVFMCFNEVIIYGLLAIFKHIIPIILVRSIVVLLLVLLFLFGIRYIVKILNCNWLFGK